MAKLDNVLLIINPNASKGRGRVKAKKIADHLNANKMKCTVAYTTGAGHAESLAKAGAENGFNIIIAAGGDGTVNEVINGIMKSGLNKKVKMGIIPVGRGNDFAWVAGIPTDTIQAADRILSRKTRACDVGFAKGSGKEKGMYFLNGMGFGFEPEVNFRAQEYKHVNGMASYVFAFLHILFFAPPAGYDLTLNIDGEIKELKSQQLSVNSGRRMGSSFLLTPKAKIDDGLLDFMYPNKTYKGGALLALVWNFLRGGVVKDPVAFSYGNARKILVDCSEPILPAHVDGEEFTKAGSHFEIEILPSAIQLF